MSNIVLKPFKKEMSNEVVKLWNENAYGHTIYAELSNEEFLTVNSPLLKIAPPCAVEVNPDMVSEIMLLVSPAFTTTLDEAYALLLNPIADAINATKNNFLFI